MDVVVGKKACFRCMWGGWWMWCCVKKVYFKCVCVWEGVGVDSVVCGKRSSNCLRSIGLVISSTDGIGINWDLTISGFKCAGIFAFTRFDLLNVGFLYLNFLNT